jgi:hypothetical protein
MSLQQHLAPFNMLWKSYWKSGSNQLALRGSWQLCIGTIWNPCVWVSLGYLWGIFGPLEPGKAEKKWETLREPSCRLNESVQCPLLSFTVAGSEEVPSKHWESLNLKQIVQDVSLLITVEKSALLTSTVL